MPQQFPHTGYHFGVFFLFPQFNFNAAFKSVSGLGFTSGSQEEVEGGNNGFKHSLTAQGNFSKLSLERGFTNDRGLYEWCEGTHTTLKTQPCNILISLLNKHEMPVKNYLIFNAIPKGWTAGGLDVNSKTVMMEKVSFTYQNFILI